MKKLNCILDDLMKKTDGEGHSANKLASFRNTRT